MLAGGFNSSSVLLHTLFALAHVQHGPVGPSAGVGAPLHHQGGPMALSDPNLACYSRYGCFPIDGPWGTGERPVSVPPQSPERIQPIFCLHTLAHPDCQVLDVDDFNSIWKSTLDPEAPLIIITHGFLESAKAEWLQLAVQTLLRRTSWGKGFGPGSRGAFPRTRRAGGDSAQVNVVTLDWGGGSSPPYSQAVANIRLVGAVTGYLVHVLTEYFDIHLSQVHMVGHSLGAHLMGYAGTYVARLKSDGAKVARITALDPAGPYFQATDPVVRLDPSDAELVDVIHTDETSIALGFPVSLGLPEAIGHVDFYPNGGIMQVGCDEPMYHHITAEEGVTKGFFSYMNCNHQRSVAYFLESIISRCKFEGVECSSWEDYQRGHCWGCSEGRCHTMGFHINDATRLARRSASPASGSGGGMQPKRVFLGTQPNPPFCGEQLKITLRMSGSSASRANGGDVAKLSVVVHSRVGHSDKFLLSDKPEYYEPGTSSSWVFTTRTLEDIRSLEIEYEEPTGFLDVLIFRFKRPHIYVKNFEVETLRGKVTTFEWCDKKMEEGKTYKLLSTERCSRF
ncbi:pancreatic triacylglycerol lipase-like [Oratosquilla oratoria]|uniref:pancreatic triacylglycerol lipase-like n=1 Tax=Oratosquilla oratoria TaxID=337810 RepID=UPI003F768E2C